MYRGQVAAVVVYGRSWFFVLLQIKKALRGLRVEVTHRGEMRRKYRIAGLTKDSARDTRFQLSTGETKSVRDYFREIYKLQLRYDFLRCLQVGTEQKPNYLPIEVCAEMDFIFSTYFHMFYTKHFHMF